jgi:hypothetical protein
MFWKGLSGTKILDQSITALYQIYGWKAKADRLLEIDFKRIHTRVKRLGILKDGGKSIGT